MPFWVSPDSVPSQVPAALRGSGGTFVRLDARREAEEDKNQLCSEKWSSVPAFFTCDLGWEKN